LTFEMDRLHKSCHRLVWLNPLLRFARFEPRAAGIRAMLPHVDGFLPVHNLDSLERLLEVLASGAVRPDGHFKFLHPWPGQIPPGQDSEECLSVG